MTAECLRCARPMADQAYACSACTASAGRSVAEIVETTSAARDVANGLSRRNGGGTSGKPGSRLPLDLGAMSKLDAVQAALTTWARATAEERTGTDWHPTGPGDVIAWAATYLAANLEWWRHRQAVDELLTDLDAAARVMRGLVRGPAEQRYLGPCGAWIQLTIRAGEEILASEGSECDGDVYGRAGGDKGTCRTCGACVDQGERRAWLDAEVRSHAYTAAEIADAYPIKANTIRQWLSRGLLTTHGELGGRPLMLLGEVLDLAAGDAARREEARATRARRTAARAAESETAA